MSFLTWLIIIFAFAIIVGLLAYVAVSDAKKQARKILANLPKGESQVKYMPSEKQIIKLQETLATNADADIEAKMLWEKLQVLLDHGLYSKDYSPTPQTTQSKTPIQRAREDANRIIATGQVDDPRHFKRLLAFLQFHRQRDPAAAELLAKLEPLKYAAEPPRREDRTVSDYKRPSFPRIFYWWPILLGFFGGIIAAVIVSSKYPESRWYDLLLVGLLVSILVGVLYYLLVFGFMFSLTH